MVRWTSRLEVQKLLKRERTNKTGGSGRYQTTVGFSFRNRRLTHITLETPPSKARRSARRQMPSVSRDFLGLMIEKTSHELNL